MGRSGQDSRRLDTAAERSPTAGRLFTRCTDDGSTNEDAWAESTEPDDESRQPAATGNKDSGSRECTDTRARARQWPRDLRRQERADQGKPTREPVVARLWADGKPSCRPTCASDLRLTVSRCKATSRF